MNTSMPDPEPGPGELPTRTSGPDRGASAGGDVPGEPVVDASRLARDVAALAPRLLMVEDRVEGIAAALDDLETALTYPALPGPTDAGPNHGAPDDGGRDDDEPGLDMRTLVDWVGNNIADLLERRVPQTSGFPRWCSTWWLHPEAIARFEALRRLWTVSVTDPGGGMAVYFSHLDQMFTVLGAEYGPFSGCGRARHLSGSSDTYLGQQRPNPAYFAEIEGYTSHALPSAGI